MASNIVPYMSAVEAFNRAACARLRAARIAAGWTQTEMAKALGVSCRTYQRYESTFGLPHYLLEDFCAITGAGLDELLSEPR